jgi:signal transduction histidine kinase
MIFAGEPSLFFFLAGVICYVLITVWIIIKRNFRQPVTGMLIQYLVVSTLLFGIEIFRQAGWLKMFRIEAIDHFPLYSMILLSWIFLGFTLQFVRSERNYLGFWLSGFVPAAIIIILDSNPFNLSEVLWRNSTSLLLRSSVAWYGMQIVWAFFVSTAALIGFHQFSLTRQPLHRNRLKYLFPILAVSAISMLLLLTGYSIPGYCLQLLASLLMLYIVFTHRLPDLRLIARASLSYSIITLLTAALFAAGFLAANVLSKDNPNNQVWIGAAIAVILALLFNPLLGMIRWLINRLLSGPRYNSAQTVQEYSSSISNILDLEMLSTIAVGSIRIALGITSGHLMLVERKKIGELYGYQLRDIPVTSDAEIEPCFLAFDSPITKFFLQQRQPLPQYDIDLLPDLQQAPGDEITWFSHSGMDIYIPVIAHDEWIGLLMVGPKASFDRYYQEDILLLSALANQTAVSLENARLVQHLVILNEEIQQAYNALNKANQQLERLDRVKTDFVSIASHELRTPLSLIMGYSDMLAGDPEIENNPFFLQMMDGIRSGSVRMQEIIVSMLDIAKIDNRTLDLAPKSISIPSLIRDIYGGLEKPIAERDLSFETVELTNLPLIEADLDAIQKVFYHLLVNAVKFTPDGGKIIVMERIVPAPQSILTKDSVEIVFSDTGVGIDPEYHDLIFTKFYQTGPVNQHSSGKTKFKGGGPGLGLTIVRGIVEAHNGKVWVESPGYDEANCPGSQFHVFLPLTQPKKEEIDRPSIKNELDQITRPIPKRLASK